MELCKKCKTHQSIRNFYYGKRGRSYTCKKCNSDICRAYRMKNRKEIKLKRAWKNMHQRCFDPNYHSWKSYGARGITVCDEWKIFENFKKDMGSTHELNLTIDRIDNDGDYTPNNCRWATRLQQTRSNSKLLGKLP